MNKQKSRNTCYSLYCVTSYQDTINGLLYGIKSAKENLFLHNMQPSKNIVEVCKYHKQDENCNTYILRTYHELL